MTDLIVAFDNEDSRLGVFFARCAEVLTGSLDESWNCITINSRSLNEMNLEIRIQQFQGNFVFASFTHGNETSLVSTGGVFMQSPLQYNLLANSFSYCFACHSGKILGRELVENGTHSFIGYSNKASIVTTYIDLFANCAIEGLLRFYRGATILQSYDFKKEKYNEEIDNLYEENFFVASILMENRDCLVFYGNGEMANTDFIY